MNFHKDRQEAPLRRWEGHYTNQPDGVLGAVYQLVAYGKMEMAIDLIFADPASSTIKPDDFAGRLIDRLRQGRGQSFRQWLIAIADQSSWSKYCLASGINIEVYSGEWLHIPEPLASQLYKICQIRSRPWAGILLMLVS